MGIIHAGSLWTLTTIGQPAPPPPPTIPITIPDPVTLGEVRGLLAARLYDTGVNLFWTNQEKVFYIQEAMRIWNSLTGYWRFEFIFRTTPGVIWYDITDNGLNPNTLRPYTVTDNYLIQMIEYHLLEPTTSAYPLLWAGSAQFAVSDILTALQRRRDEVISNSGCTVTHRLVGAIPGRTVLPTSVIDIRRVAWLPVANAGNVYKNNPLFADDEFGDQNFGRGTDIAGNGNPMEFKRNVEPQHSFDVDISPAVNGQYDVLTVDIGPTLKTDASTVFMIPDDFSWVTKWGAMADLLSRESNAKDSLRAQYCEARFRQGIAALSVSPAILYAKINNADLDIESIQNLDTYRTGWMAEAQKQPDTLGIAGLNMVATAAIPDQIYSILLGVVMNAPIPQLDGDIIPIGRDDLEALLDYAQHIASFKMGGTEFMSTLPLLERFHSRAGTYNNKLNELGAFTKPIFDQSQLQAENFPVFETDLTDKDV